MVLFFNGFRTFEPNFPYRIYRHRRSCVGVWFTNMPFNGSFIYQCKNYCKWPARICLWIGSWWWCKCEAMLLSKQKLLRSKRNIRSLQLSGFTPACVTATLLQSRTSSEWHRIRPVSKESKSWNYSNCRSCKQSKAKQLISMSANLDFSFCFCLCYLNSTVDRHPIDVCQALAIQFKHETITENRIDENDAESCFSDVLGRRKCHTGQWTDGSIEEWPISVMLSSSTALFLRFFFERISFYCFDYFIEWWMLWSYWSGYAPSLASLEGIELRLY